MQTNTHKLLQGLAMGDTVMFVTSSGKTCPATLLSAPQPIAPENHLVTNTELQPIIAAAVMILGSGLQTTAMYSASPEAGCWFLSEKQHWMMDNWNIWQNGQALADAHRSMPENGMAQFADGPMGGPIRGGARLEALTPPGMPEGVIPQSEREPEMVGASPNYDTPPP